MAARPSLTLIASSHTETIAQAATMSFRCAGMLYMQVLQPSGDDCKLFMSSAEGIMYIPRSWSAVRRGGLLVQRTGPSMGCVILSIFHLVSFSPPFFFLGHADVLVVAAGYSCTYNLPLHICKMCTKVILNGKIPRLALAIDPCPLESARFLTTSAVFLKESP